MFRISLRVALAALLATATLAFAPQSPAHFPVDALRPGMTGVGRTVFSGDKIEEFQVEILGVLRNVTGPRRDLILTRLSGGPLATTGVIQGMSGSPVYIDGKLVGAVSYALGSFPKEPLAGLTPIGEMIEAATPRDPASTVSEVRTGGWPTAPADVYAELTRVAERMSAPLGGLSRDLRVLGPESLAGLAPTLRPIGAAMVFSGFDPTVDRDLRQAFRTAPAQQSPASSASARADAPLRPGDPVGVSLIRGDFEVGATGTVTHVDGSRVFAFGHPFLNLGPTALAMTRARVFAVIPSLDSSMKIAILGPVVGTISQDRMTGIGGTLGASPRELAVNLTLASSRGQERRLEFKIAHDQMLTPLFAYVALLNSLMSFEKQLGPLTIAASGTINFGGGSSVVIDDLFSGDAAAAAAASGTTAAIGIAAANEFRPALAESLDITLKVSDRTSIATIERAWLDTTKPRAGADQTVHVLLRDYRGGTSTVSVPITMPSQPGPVTILVADGPTLTGLEDRDLRPGRATSWTELVTRMNSARRNNRLYVRLISSSAGTVVGGTTLPALPASVRSVFDDDKAVATAAVARSVIGSWEQRLDKVVRGSRELNLTVIAR